MSAPSTFAQFCTALAQRAFRGASAAWMLRTLRPEASGRGALVHARYERHMALPDVTIATPEDAIGLYELRGGHVGPYNRVLVDLWRQAGVGGECARCSFVLERGWCGPECPMCEREYLLALGHAPE